jgi:glutamyl-tRNA reductase
MESPSQLTLLGVSFRTAPVAVREALRYPADQAAGLLRQATATRPGLEALILSTCNRTEFYLPLRQIATPPANCSPCFAKCDPTPPSCMTSVTGTS